MTGRLADSLFRKRSVGAFEDCPCVCESDDETDRNEYRQAIEPQSDRNSAECAKARADPCVGEAIIGDIDHVYSARF